MTSALVTAFAAHQRRSFGIFMRDLLEQAIDVERALHRVDSAGHLTYEQQSRLRGRVRFLMVQADLRGRGIDIEAVIAAEIRREPAIPFARTPDSVLDLEPRG